MKLFSYHRKDALICERTHLSYDIKTRREDAHSRDKKMSIKRLRSAREFRLRNSFLFCGHNKRRKYRKDICPKENENQRTARG